MRVLIDNGHGSNTPGKRSPDGTLREYAYTREIAKRLVPALIEEGFEAELVTPETYDVSLTTRVKRINRICNQVGSKNVLVVSIHNDAKGMGSSWEKARGWSVRVSLNASTNSKKLASCLASAAESEGIKVRRPIDTPTKKQDYWLQNLAICRDTLCPAVLTENLFQDNKQDVEWLLTEKGKDTLVRLHINGIKNYIKSLE